MTPTNTLKKTIIALGLLLALAACTLTDATSVQTTPQVEGIPVVKLASPLPNEAYAIGASVQILARIENAGIDIELVDVLLDNRSIGSVTRPNESGANAFTITNSWLATENGDHIVMLRAIRADGTVGETSVTISVEGESVLAMSTATSDLGLPTPVQTAQVAPTKQATQQSLQPPTLAATTQAPASDPTATNTSAPPASTSPQISVIAGANIRSGPGVSFAPPVGSLAAGATGDIIAISPDGQWYKIRYNNGQGSGWINATTVTTTGNLAGLPIDAGPATPAPAPTAAPATAAPTVAASANIDLSITLLSTSPDPFVCNQPATITVIVVNTGATQSQETTLLVQDLYGGAGGNSTTATVKPLGQNESVQLSLALTVSTNYNEGHTLLARVDPNNVVPENNETNNDNNKAYTLSQGGC